MTTIQLKEHLEGLRGISTVASKIFNLLGEQITSASHTIPIQRGIEIVKNLKDEAKAHRAGLKTAFDPLHDQINETKVGFWGRHGSKLETLAQKYIEEKVRERVPVEVNKVMNHYFQYLETNEARQKELKEAIEVSEARLKNSLLRVKYPEEAISWAVELPVATFEELINTDGPSMLNVAQSLGLSPGRDDDRIEVLNSIMKNLGIAYKGLPAWTGVLLVPTKTNP